VDVTESAASFLAVVLETSQVADEALGTVRALEHEQDVSVHDAVVVIRTELGRIELEQTREFAAGDGIVSGGSAGLIAGVLLGLPVGGALLGLVGGALFAMRDTGIPDNRMRKLGEDLQPGQAMLCVLVEAAAIPRMREALGGYGTVVDVELSPGAGP
jgi:uncharacterized membrane protein